MNKANSSTKKTKLLRKTTKNEDSTTELAHKKPNVKNSNCDKAKENVIGRFFKNILGSFSSKAKNGDNPVVNLQAIIEPEKINLSGNLNFEKNLDNFTNQTAENIMIPRSDIFAVSKNIKQNELLDLIVKNNHTRTLVYHENLDNIIGFIHIKDLFKMVTQGEKYNLTSLIRKHIVCPYSMKLVNLLQQMQKNRTHIAVIVDEYGGTDGIITIEDLMEEIFGRIDDEHDVSIEESDLKVLSPEVVMVNARIEIEEIERLLSISLRNEDDDFETIGGLVISKLGHIPRPGDIVEVSEGVKIEVTDATPRNIKQLKIIISPTQNAN